jgi:dihydropteroate synthase
MIFHNLRLRGQLLSLAEPLVMGILNTTPDSFFDGGRYVTLDAALRQAEKMRIEGATILDIGGASSRPGAAVVSVSDEIARVVPLIMALKKEHPDMPLSIDTWRTAVLQEAVAAGADIVNDISAGRMDEGYYEALAELGVPYVLMHMQGTPDTMQKQPQYEDVVTTVLDFFIAETARLRALGVTDIVLDPGFGFGKTTVHNYTLLKNLSVFSKVMELPVLVGVSRKSMIYKYLDIQPEDALPATTALHLFALQQGANILRAHDVAEARQAIRLWACVATPFPV